MRDDHPTARAEILTREKVVQTCFSVVVNFDPVAEQEREPEVAVLLSRSSSVMIVHRGRRGGRREGGDERE